MQERLNATLLTVSLFHVSGFIMMLMLNLAFGGKVVMMRKWDADEAARLIEREQVRHSSACRRRSSNWR
jgi:long-chain acyl-CoA synthetase